MSKKPATPSIEQAETQPVTVRQIMNDPAFKAGVDDVRAGRPARFDQYDCWEYERGRQFAMLVPTTMPLRIRGKLNLDALVILSAAFRSGTIT
jgi:hypothetical protein